MKRKTVFFQFFFTNAAWKNSCTFVNVILVKGDVIEIGRFSSTNDDIEDCAETEREATISTTTDVPEKKGTSASLIGKI